MCAGSRFIQTLLTAFGGFVSSPPLAARLDFTDFRLYRLYRLYRL